MPTLKAPWPSSPRIRSRSSCVMDWTLLPVEGLLWAFQILARSTAFQEKSSVMSFSTISCSKACEPTSQRLSAPLLFSRLRITLQWVVNTRHHTRSLPYTDRLRYLSVLNHYFRTTNRNFRYSSRAISTMIFNLVRALIIAGLLPLSRNQMCSSPQEEVKRWYSSKTTTPGPTSLQISRL